jgi:hypothetical protein
VPVSDIPNNNLLIDIKNEHRNHCNHSQSPSKVLRNIHELKKAHSPAIRNSNEVNTEYENKYNTDSEENICVKWLSERLASTESNTCHKITEATNLEEACALVSF